MSYVYPRGEWPEYDPPPEVPTLEEIELADELRHELECKYLGKPAPAIREYALTSYGWSTAADD